ncbi:MAG TPA: uracil-DNA glycosylase family protein [Patescibacteria group bacterium]|nr:uracil-DNA glycosylase family protein [Patescibacteria group bacterium]
MLRYWYKNAKLLFVGINPHFGSFNRGVPFSNNKLFWYLLARAGLIAEPEAELKNDKRLQEIYAQKFHKVYQLGFVNVIDRPTRDISALKKGEEIKGRKKIQKIIKQTKPPVVCFIGKIAYQKFSGKEKVSFGWQKRLGESKIFLMHFPLRGKASVRVEELKEAAKAAQIDLKK